MLVLLNFDVAAQYLLMLWFSVHFDVAVCICIDMPSVSVLRDGSVSALLCRLSPLLICFSCIGSGILCKSAKVQ